MEWMWGSRPRRLFLRRRQKRLSGSNNPKSGLRLRLALPSSFGWPLSLLDVLVFADAGRLGLYSTTMSRAAAMMSRLTADSAVRRMPST